MDHPRVSVCTRTWCRDASLKMTIGSFLAQSFEDFELLVADDSSPNDTALTVGLCSFGPRLRHLRLLQTLGPAGNWNRGITEACGKYIKAPRRYDLIAVVDLKRQVTVFDAPPDVLPTFSSRNLIGKSNPPLSVKGRLWEEGHVATNASRRRRICSGTKLP